jgi:hypothetical protein
MNKLLRADSIALWALTFLVLIVTADSILEFYNRLELSNPSIGSLFDLLAMVHMVLIAASFILFVRALILRFKGRTPGTAAGAQVNDIQASTPAKPLNWPMLILGSFLLVIGAGFVIAIVLIGACC